MQRFDFAAGTDTVLPTTLPGFVSDDHAEDYADGNVVGLGAAESAGHGRSLAYLQPAFGEKEHHNASSSAKCTRQVPGASASTDSKQGENAPALAPRPLLSKGCRPGRNHSRLASMWCGCWQVTPSMSGRAPWYVWRTVKKIITTLPLLARAKISAAAQPGY